MEESPSRNSARDDYQECLYGGNGKERGRKPTPRGEVRRLTHELRAVTSEEVVQADDQRTQHQKGKNPQWSPRPAMKGAIHQARLNESRQRLGVVEASSIVSLAFVDTRSITCGLTSDDLKAFSTTPRHDVDRDRRGYSNAHARQIVVCGRIGRKFIVGGSGEEEYELLFDRSNPLQCPVEIREPLPASGDEALGV